MADKFVLTAQLQLQAPKNVKQVHKQIQSQLKGASVDIEVKNAAKSVKDLNKIASATKDVQTASKKAGTSADAMGKAFGSALKNVLRYDLARRVFSAFANTIEQGLKDAIQFEREMIKIAQVSGQTMKQLQGLQRTITGLSTSLGVASSSLVKVGLILKQTGLSVKDTQLAMAALAKSELAPTFDNITDTAETAVAAMRQFGIEASRLENLLSKINTVAGNFAIEASDIGVAIKRAGGAFKAAGGSVEELIALMTSVRSTTRETAETIATGFRTIFTRLQRPTTIKFLRQFGIELTDLEGKFVGPYEAVRRLSSALQGLSPQDLRFSTIVEQLGGFRQVSKVIPLIQQFGTAQQALNAQLAGGDSLAKDAATAQQSLAVQMQKVTENVKELFREIAASDSFQALAKTALVLANAITQIGKALAPVLPILTTFLAAKAVGWGVSKTKLFGGSGIGKSLGSATGDASDMFRGNKGGRVRRFSNGGWVPGTGNGDTVPAMLEPGEFVLRKSAAQAYGSQLNGVNKYKKGGVARVDSIGNVYDGDSFNATVVDGTTPYGTSTRLKDYDAVEAPAAGGKEDNLFTKRGLKHPHWIAKEIAEKYVKARGKGMKKAFFDSDGKPYGRSSDQRERPMFKADTLGNRLVSAGVGASGGDKAKFKMDAYVAARDAEGRRTKPGTPGGQGWWRTVKGKSVFSGLAGKNKSIGRKKGNKFAKGGEVPSLLTPGEFVVNKKSAQSIGYGKLRNMNKYARGGSVRRYAGGTGGTGVMGGGMMGSMMNMAFMGELSKSTGKATKGIYSMAEGAYFSYAKIQLMGATANAVGTQLGMGGKALDAFTGILSQSIGLITAFNTVMKTAVVQQGLDSASSALSGFGDVLTSFGGKFKGGGKIGKLLGGKLGKVGERLGTRSVGFGAGKVHTARTAANAATEAAAQAQKKVVDLGAKFAKRAKLIQAEKIAQAAGKGTPGRMGGLVKAQNSTRAAVNAAAKSSATAAKGMATAGKTAAKTAKIFRAVNIAALVATYAFSKWGEAIEASAMKGIADTGGDFAPGQEATLRRKAGTGGAMQGAAIAAGVALLIPGVGLLAAGLILATGAVIGWYTSVAAAEKAIKAAKFRGSLDSLASAMDLVTKKQMSAATALSTLVSTIGTMNTNISGVGPDEAAKGLSTVAKSSDVLVAQLAKEAQTVGQFNASLGRNVQILKDQGFLQEKQLEILREEILVRQKVQEKLEQFTIAQEEANKRLIKLAGIGTVFDELGSRMKKFGTTIESISLSGNAGIGGGLAGEIRPEAGDPESVTRFENAIEKLSNIGGEGSTGLDQFKEQAKDIGFLSRNLDSILRRAGAGGKLSPERAQTRIQEELKTALAQEDRAGLGSTTQTHFDKMLQSVGEDVVSDIKGNMDKIKDTLMTGQQGVIDQFINAANQLDKHNADLIKAYADKRSLEYQSIKAQQNILQSMQDSQARFEVNTSVGQLIPGRSNAQIQSQFNDRQRLALSKAGGKTGAGAGSFSGSLADVTALGVEFKRLGKALVESREGIARSKALDKDGQLAGNTQQLISANDKLRQEYDLLKGVLVEYGSSQQRLVALNKELAQSQKRQQTIRDLAIKTMFGTAQEKDDAARIINAVEVAMQKGLHAVAPGLQRQVIGLLEGGFRGQEGKDLVQNELGKNFGKGITSASTETNKIAAEIQKAEKIGIAAGKALQAEMQGRADAMGTEIASQNENFLKGMRKLLLHQAERELKKDMAVAKEEMKTAQETFKLLKSLGIDPNQEGAQQTLNLLKQNSQAWKDLTDKEARSPLKKSENLKDFLTKTSSSNFDDVFDDLANSFDTWTQAGQQKAIQDNPVSYELTKLMGGLKNVQDVLGEGWLKIGEVNASMGDYYDEAGVRGMEALFGKGAKADQFEDTNDGAKDRISAEAAVRANRVGDGTTGGIIRSMQQSFGHLFEDDKGGQAAYWDFMAKAVGDAVEKNLGVEEMLGGMLREFSRREQEVATNRKSFETSGGEYDPSVKQMQDYLEAIKSDKNNIKLLEQPIADLISKFKEAQNDFNAAREDWNTLPGRKGDEAFVKIVESNENIKGEKGPTEADRERAKAAVTSAIQASLKLKTATPSMDVLAREGMRSQGGLGSPSSNATRATLMQAGWSGPTSQVVQGGVDTRTSNQPTGARTSGSRTLQIKQIENLQNLQTRGLWSGEQRGTVGLSQRGKEAHAGFALKSGALGEGEAAQKRYKMLTDNDPTNDRKALEGLLPSPNLTDEFHKSGMTDGSIYTHDTHAEALLTEMLTIMKGNPGQKDAAYRAGANTGDASGVYASIDTENLDKSIQLFSKDIAALAKTLSQPMTLEVSGEVVVNVKLNGAEFLTGAMDSIGRYVGHKVTGGINNFIRKGLRDTRVATSTKWDDDDTSDQTMAGNNSSGSMS